MNRFLIVPTTADVAIEAFGATEEDLFAQVGLGLFSIMCELETVEPRESLQAVAEAPDHEALLVQWLNELIYLHEVNEFLACEVRVVEVSERGVKGELRGERVDPERHSLLTEVKAATYHQLTLEQVGSPEGGGPLGEALQGWRAYVLVDI